VLIFLNWIELLWYKLCKVALLLLLLLLLKYTEYYIVIFHVKSKAVPLHAMEALGGRGGITPASFLP
jgi:hypothetical protein